MPEQVHREPSPLCAAPDQIPLGGVAWRWMLRRRAERVGRADGWLAERRPPHATHLANSHHSRGAPAAWGVVDVWKLRRGRLARAGAAAAPTTTSSVPSLPSPGSLVVSARGSPDLEDTLFADWPLARLSQLPGRHGVWINRRSRTWTTAPRRKNKNSPPRRKSADPLLHQSIRAARILRCVL